MIAKNESYEDDLYDLDGLCKRLGKSELSIRRMANRREIPSFRIGNKLMFSLREVLEATRVPTVGNSKR